MSSPIFKSVTAPNTAKKPQISTYHNFTRIDDYAWLRADNWQEMFKDPSQLASDIRDHLNEENAYQKELMQDTEILQATLFAEMKGRIKEDEPLFR